MQEVRQYTLGELAAAAAMTERNVRAYQSRGLLPPAWRDGRRATYGDEHVARLRLVRALHQHGLTLRVIADLVDRGTADAELARLGRQELPAVGSYARVPMSQAVVEAFQREHPDGLDALVEARLVTRVDGRYEASATGLGIVAALSARGVGVADSREVSLQAAAAATACAEGLAAARDDLSARSGADRAELTMLVVQLAACAFADVLASRIAVEDGAAVDGTDRAARAAGPGRPEVS